MTIYPDNNPKTIHGQAKPGLLHVPPVPMFKVGQVMDVGATKYGPANWRDAPVTQSTYINAALRPSASQRATVASQSMPRLA